MYEGRNLSNGKATVRSEISTGKKTPWTVHFVLEDMIQNISGKLNICWYPMPQVCIPHEAQQMWIQYWFGDASHALITTAPKISACTITSSKHAIFSTEASSTSTEILLFEHWKPLDRMQKMFLFVPSWEYRVDLHYANQICVLSSGSSRYHIPLSFFFDVQIY